MEFNYNSQHISTDEITLMESNKSNKLNSVNLSMRPSPTASDAVIQSSPAPTFLAGVGQFPPMAMFDQFNHPIPPVVASNSNSSTSHPVSVPSHEVFVGNLSYFCQEHDLFTLFDEYSHAKNVRIVWNEDHSRPLMYGFVVLASQQEVMEIKKLLDGHLFMGRHLRCVGHCL